MPISQAAIHEESRTHRSFVNALNEIRAAPSSPLSPTQRASDLPSSHHFSSPLPRSSPPVDPDNELPHFQPSAGPWLPDDDPNEIFDDYSGPYGALMPSPEEPTRNSGHEDKQGEVELSDSEAEEFEGEAEIEGEANGEVMLAPRQGHEVAAEMEPANATTEEASADKARSYLGGSSGAIENENSGGTTQRGDKRRCTTALQGDTYFGPAVEPEDLTQSEALPDDWWPWTNREEALLDIMHAFPRSVFSETELEATLWFTAKCGVEDLPTVRQVKYHRDRVLRLCGVDPQLVEGKLGNLFALNDFAKIVAHEMANPLVRKHMHFFGEDAGSCLKEAWQGSRWKDQVNASASGPMVRHEGKDFFVNEPALVRWGPRGKYQPVLPTRFFRRNGMDWAKVHLLRRHPAKDAMIVDARQGACTELPLTSFWASFPEFQADHGFLGWPDPSLVPGIARRGEWNIEDLEVENHEIISPNPIRKLAGGKRVLPLPIWFYCDDTSGNLSKKWNKHNSLLFTLAGLPREYAEVIYNIHFLATSNHAQPLEMFDAVIKVLQDARDKGIFAYDCYYDEVVMLIPWILAMVGDNPMQSEFSSHIGLSGTCFCRVCTVKGSDKDERATGDPGEFQRLSRFLKPQTPRSKASVEAALQSQLQKILDGVPSSVAAMATASGVKDKYFQHFADRLSKACASIKEQQQSNPLLRGQEYLRRELQKIRDTMPQNIFSPSLRLDDFQPSSHTPVEILHVLLLGFVKYFWRDAVSRQKADGKEVLKARLNSFNAKGLGLPRIKGHTFVQYAGSLNGGDFRVILQVAPSVLHGLIPDAAYEAWLALCALAPLVFQPEIDDLPAYLDRLQIAIDDFLAATALWNTRWFNKPKFHIVLHIIHHIRLFGPALLFATETFESYNFVIRARSINSNRHAPSLDIGHSFSHMHAIRHLASGGYILMEDSESQHRQPHARQAGREVLNLLKDRVFVKLMGMQKLVAQSQHGLFTVDARQPQIDWQSTHAGRLYPTPRSVTATSVIRRCSAAIIHDGSVIRIGAFILFQNTNHDQPRVGKVEEIVADVHAKRLTGILIQEYQTGHAVAPYHFPKLIRGPYAPVLCTIKVIQERRATELLENELKHSIEPDDVLLNLAQLHSASLVQAFRPSRRYPNMPLDTLIWQSIRNRHVLEGTNLDTEVPPGPEADPPAIPPLTMPHPAMLPPVMPPDGSGPSSLPQNPVITPPIPEEAQEPPGLEGMPEPAETLAWSGRKRAGTSTTDSRAKRSRPGPDMGGMTLSFQIPNYKK
ncbi:hypothetical protein HWV62_25136 [Athelia sp. TMB]|nr:hypothetical protein HWV62_25136 [Athelia sp. TMB]